MENKEITERDKSIDVMRSVLLLSIISAHSSITFAEVTGIFRFLVWQLWQFWSIVGVPGFLIISGYLYQGNQEDCRKLVIKKAKSILIPWFFCGTIIFFISQFGGYSVSRYLAFLVGNGSYLYYMSIICLCFIIFYWWFDKIFFLLLCIFINLGSLFLFQENIYTLPFSNSLNIFNWLGYFSIGLLMKKFNGIYKYKLKSKGIYQYIGILGVGLLGGTIFGSINYFFVQSYFFAIISLIGIYGICLNMSGKICDILSLIGRWSFSIYLLHMPIVSMLKKIVRMSVIDFYILIPCITVLLFYIIFHSSLWEKVSMKYRILAILIGMRH